MITEPTDPLEGLTDEEFTRLSGYPIDDYVYVRNLLDAERRENARLREVMENAKGFV